MELEIISEIENIIQVTIGKKKERDSFGYAVNETNNISELNIGNCQIFQLNKIIPVLKKLPSLVSLNLSENHISDIGKLTELPQLVDLDLSGNNILDIVPLINLPNLETLNLSNSKLKDFESLGKLIQVKHLTLNNLGIENLYPLAKLHNLTNLNLGHTKVKDLSPLANLQHLLSLNLTNTKTIDYNTLSSLTRLNELDLSSTQFSDVRFLSSLENLVDLDLSANKITDITPLSELPNLIDLTLLDNKIRDMNQFKSLIQLTRLNLGKNHIKDILPLENLKLLKSLWLIENDIKNHDVISSLQQLEALSLGNNKLRSISFLKDLKKLRRLDLQQNQISDISPLENLVKLVQLNLDSNLVENVKALKKLKLLRMLQLQRNPINTLPNWITEFTMSIQWSQYGYDDGFITFFENPLKNPPIEIVKQGSASVHRYFEKIEKEGVDYIYEAKLTLVGEGSSGKTSLQKRLINEKAILPRKDKRTRGIEINDWKFKKVKNTNHIAHIWDFGGQDVYYPVHRFFITENSVFILLASTRQTHHNFDYWIPTIYQFGGKSPIILGQTCHDGNRVQWNDLGIYVGNPNFNIIKTITTPFYEINLPNKNEGLRKIKQTIINQIASLPHYGKGVPKPWVSIRNILSIESKRAACISIEKFQEICRNSSPESFSNSRDITDCCQFLHDIGVVLWYSSIEELKNWVILQPEWAMNAVYKIIDDEEIQKRKGNILSKDFNRLWSDASYEHKHPILKKMLEVFKIAFSKKHKQQDYIIPARLLSMPSEKKWDDTESFLRLEYRYEFMPRGMVNQISAELSRYIISDDEVWNNAVNFHSEDNASKCQVEEDFYNRKIIIRSKGKDARGLIVLVMNTLKNITDGYNGVKPQVYVPCTCSKCKKISRPTTFLYDDLLRWSEDKENARVTCNESGDSQTIEELLYNVGLSAPHISEKKSRGHSYVYKKPLDLFVSYSKHDEDYLQDFQDHLVTLKDEGLVTFDCRDIEFGKEWDKTIKQKLEQCDIMVCLVSVKFLNTEYIKKIEIEKAVQEGKIIIPIIIKSCDWETSILGKYQAAQRGRVVSLDNNLKLVERIKSNNEEEKAAFWTAIIKEFRKKIFI